MKILIARNPFFIKYHRAEKNKELNCMKIDFLVFLANHFALPVQIKSGRNARRGIIEHYKNCPYVLALQIRTKHTPERIASRVEKIVKKFLRDPFKDRIRQNHETKTPAN